MTKWKGRPWSEATWELMRTMLSPDGSIHDVFAEYVEYENPGLLKVSKRSRRPLPRIFVEDEAFQIGGPHPDEGRKSEIEGEGEAAFFPLERNKP